MRFGITKKFLFAFLTLSLLPLVALSIYARQKVVQVGEEAFSTTREELVKNASSLLEARARSIAQQVTLFLQGSADDLRTLSHLPTDVEVYAGFNRSHQRTVWSRICPHGSPAATHAVTGAGSADNITGARRQHTHPFPTAVFFRR